MLAVDKPAGFYVHPPESGHPIADAVNCLSILRTQLGRYLYPVHRLDRATSGVLVYAFSSEVAAQLQAQWRSGEVEKTYYALVRGWLTVDGEARGRVERELDGKPAATRLERLAVMEIKEAVGRYPSARYSLVRAEIETGRFHQIRRHCAGLGYPLIGDSVHGDGEHNHFMRERLGPGLWLKSQELCFRHPVSGDKLRLHSRWSGRWHRVFDLMGLCPLG